MRQLQSATAIDSAVACLSGSACYDSTLHHGKDTDRNDENGDHDSGDGALVQLLRLQRLLFTMTHSNTTAK